MKRIIKAKTYVATSPHAVSERADRYQRSSDTFVFRGHSQASWRLDTPIERAAKDYGVSRSELARREPGLIRLFKRQYHHYSDSVPDPQDYIEWLSLMQHHGAPSRLLDWTYSFHVALFFAVEEATGPCAVWALNVTKFNAILSARYPDAWALLEPSGRLCTVQQFREVFARRPRRPLVAFVNPYRTHVRLNTQQAVSLCPGDITQPFEANLAAMIGRHPAAGVLHRLRIGGGRRLRQAILRRLHGMNITRATLYPGLDGFASSLKGQLAFYPDTLPPDDEWDAAGAKLRRSTT